MSTLKERLRADVNDARRARDKLRTLVLSTTLSELKNREIETGREATDEDVVEVVTKGIKKRREAADQIRAAGRIEMADRENRIVPSIDAHRVTISTTTPYCSHSTSRYQRPRAFCRTVCRVGSGRFRSRHSRAKSSSLMARAPCATSSATVKSKGRRL